MFLFLQPEVSSATVNLATETALVQLEPSPEKDAKKEKVAEQLAAQLTKAGFKSTLRGENILSPCL